MSIWLWSLAGVSMLGGLALMAYWLVALFRIWQNITELPTARDGIALADADPPTESVCVVVPAHNEEAVIGDLIDSLRAQDHDQLRFVLVLDRCTDSTARIARERTAGDDRFEIIELDECPPQWAGKVHAVWTGATKTQSARDADLILFVDADTELDPRLIRATAALMRDRRLDLLSLWSTLAVERWFEKLVQPACGIELMYQYPLRRANRFENRRAFANGQYMFFRRDAYERIGGHEAVNEAVLEDMALARVAADHGLRVGVFLANLMLIVHMYQTWAAFLSGWKRIYIDCAKRKPSRLRRHAWRLRLVQCVLPGIALGGIVLGVWVLPASWITTPLVVCCTAAMGVWLLSLILIYRMGRFPIWATFLQPIGAWLTARVMLQAARDLDTRTPLVWGGREYQIEPR